VRCHAAWRWDAARCNASTRLRMCSAAH
jgi:hypothetical protein